MKAIGIRNAEVVVEAISDEIKKSPEGRYFHRLHVAMLLAKGLGCSKVAQLFDESLRTVQAWAKALNEVGISALQDKSRPGKPPRLTDEQKESVKKDIGQGPQAFGYDQGFWDGPLLSHHIETHYGVKLGVRQCQRFFHKIGYTLQRPQTKPSGSTIEAREAFKKTTYSRR